MTKRIDPSRTPGAWRSRSAAYPAAPALRTPLSPEEAQQWRWESLRRTTAYREDWARAGGSPGVRQVESMELYQRYRIYPAQSPLISHLCRGVVLLPLYPRMYGSSRSPGKHEIDRRENEAILVYDLLSPIEDQIKRSATVLRDAQEKFARRRPSREMHLRERRQLIPRTRWPLLLRVVDAVHDLAGSIENLCKTRGATTEIARELDLCLPKQATVYVRDFYGQGVTMWQWLPYPKLGSKT